MVVLPRVSMEGRKYNFIEPFRMLFVQFFVVLVLIKVSLLNKEDIWFALPCFILVIIL